MRANSLALRLFLSATAVTVVILLITGVVLSSLYRDGAERSFDRRLDVYLKTLVADVSAPEEAENHKSPGNQGSDGRQPQDQRVRVEARLQKDEFAVARDKKIDHRGITISCGNSLAQQNAQVARQRRIRIVDRLILANHTAQL